MTDVCLIRTRGWSRTQPQRAHSGRQRSALWRAVREAEPGDWDGDWGGQGEAKLGGKRGGQGALRRLNSCARAWQAACISTST